MCTETWKWREWRWGDAAAAGEPACLISGSESLKESGECGVALIMLSRVCRSTPETGVHHMLMHRIKQSLAKVCFSGKIPQGYV